MDFAFPKITKMLDIPELKSTDPKQLLTFASKLHNSVSELSKGEEASELPSQGNIRFMSLKLPTSLREKWSGICYEPRPRQLNLVNLDDWLTKLSNRKEYDQLLHGALEESLKSKSRQTKPKPEQNGKEKKPDKTSSAKSTINHLSSATPVTTPVTTSPAAADSTTASK